MTGRRAGSDLRPRPQVAGEGRVTVLTSAGSPEWMQRWCRSAGRSSSSAAVPATEPVGLAVPELVTRAAREGAAVLLVRAPMVTNRVQPLVVAAVRGLPEDAPVVEEAARCAAAIGARLQLVHAVPTSFAEKSVGLPAAIDHAHTVLALGRRRAVEVAAGLDVDGLLLRARPHEVVGELLDADLLVLGGPRPRTDGVLGLVARSAVHHAPCSVLLVPRGADGRDDRPT